MKIEEQIKSYWERIGKVEERIQELARKGLDYSAETNKRKSLLTNIKRLEKEKKLMKGGNNER